MQRTLVSAFAAAALAAPHPTDAREIKVIAACPGQSLTLSYLVGKISASTRVCMKMVSALDGKPTSAEFWKIGTLGQIEGLGTKDGSACFDYSVTLAGRQELRAGGFKSSTSIYMVEVDTTRGLRLPFDDHDLLLSAIKTPSEDSYRGAIDPCRPRCEQVPPPKLSERLVERGCYHTCDRSGNWRSICESYDSKTGKKIPPR